MLRFAILQTLETEKNSVVLEYQEEQVLTRLQARTKENLADKESKFKSRHTKDQVAEALAKAFNDLVTEFKEKTVTLV